MKNNTQRICPECGQMLPFSTYAFTRFSGFECPGCGSVLRRKKIFTWSEVFALMIFIPSMSGLASKDTEVFSLEGSLCIFLAACSAVFNIFMQAKSEFKVLYSKNK